MMQEISVDEAKGKTVSGFHASSICGQAVLIFTDGTFTTFGIDRGYERGDEVIEQQRLKLTDFGYEVLIELGIMSWKEVCDRHYRLDQMRSAEQEHAERVQYERLKKKFGG